MNRLTLILLIPILLCSCKKDDKGSYSESAVISSGSSFGSILIDVKPFVMVGNEKNYLVTDTLYRVTLSVDDSNWGYNNSFVMDTSVVDQQIFNSYRITTSDLTYSAKIPYSTGKDTLNTAGEYAALLNRQLTLRAGFYHCRLDSFQLKTNDGILKTFRTNQSKVLEVKDNERNTYLGTFEVEVK